MHTDRLQPSLLDRLTDEAPAERHESREQRFLTVRRLRAAVLRDLGWLLNAVAWQADAAFEQVHSATLCYGIPGLAGLSACTLDGDELARRVHEAILRFEPRILAEGLRVQVSQRAGPAGPGTLAMTIEGALWAVPAPLRLVVNTSIDLESGRVVVSDASR